MITNPFLNSSETTIIILIICCAIILAVVMIPKAIRHRRKVKEHQPVDKANQEVEIMIVPEVEEKTDYKLKFLQTNRMKKRECVYISHATHRKIVKLTKALDDTTITIGGYIDNILKDHLENHKDDINRIYNQKRGDLV